MPDTGILIVVLESFFLRCSGAFFEFNRSVLLKCQFERLRIERLPQAAE